jgi:hypothetical protein
VGREKFLKCDFFNYIKIKNHKKWESAKTEQNYKRARNKAHLSEDTSLKLNFNRRKLTQFWLSVQQTCPTLSTEALKALHPFSSPYICEVGFSAMVGMKTKFRNKLQLSNSLRLKIIRTQSQSHVTTDGQPVSQSWCRAPSGAHDQMFVAV